LEGHQGVGEQVDFDAALLAELALRQLFLNEPEGEADDKDGQDNHHAEGGENAVEKFHKDWAVWQCFDYIANMFYRYNINLSNLCYTKFL